MKVFVVRAYNRDANKFSLGGTVVTDTVISTKKAVLYYQKSLESWGYKLDKFFCGLGYGYWVYIKPNGVYKPVSTMVVRWNITDVLNENYMNNKLKGL